MARRGMTEWSVAARPAPPNQRGISVVPRRLAWPGRCSFGTVPSLQTERRRRGDMAKTEAVRRNGMVHFTVRAPATVRAELAAADTRRALLGEFLGSLLFVILGAGTVIVTGGILGEKLGSARLLVLALAQGLAFLMLVAATMPMSGGHLNPAVTFAMMIARKMNVTRGAMYMVMQCLGAVAGALVLTLIMPQGTHGNLGAHGLGGNVS